MNKTYCGGKFVFKDEMDEEDLKRERHLDKECAKGEMMSFGKERLKTVKRDRKLCREIRKAVFAYLESIGHKPSDVEVIRQYASKRLENEEVVHFRLKGLWLKDYKFGIWINPKNFFMKDYEDMTKSEKAAFDKLPAIEAERTRVAVQIFQQHKDYIDRFAPSYSEPVIEITRDDAKTMLSGYHSLVSKGGKVVEKRKYGQFGFDIEYLGKLIAFMQKHPFKHFGGLLSHGKHLVGYANFEEIDRPFLHFVKERTRFHFNRVAKSIRRWIGLRKALRVCKGLAKEDCVKRVVMTSFGNCVCPGCLTDYEFEITVAFDGTHTLKEFSEAFDRHITEDGIGLTGSCSCVAEVMANGLTVDGGLHDKRKKKHRGDGRHTTENGRAVLFNFHGRKNDEKRYKKLVRAYESVRDGDDRDARRRLLGEHPTLESFLKSHEFDPEKKRTVRGLGRLTKSGFDILETLD